MYMYTDIPCFIVLCSIVLDRYHVSYKLKVCGNSTLRKSIIAIFPTACAHFVSLCHILVILAVFKIFLLLYWLRWSVIFDAAVVIVLGCHETHPCETLDLIDNVGMCSDCPTDWPFPHLSSSPQASLFHEIQYWN